jgi:hypothetical protein
MQFFFSLFFSLDLAHYLFFFFLSRFFLAAQPNPAFFLPLPSSRMA